MRWLKLLTRHSACGGDVGVRGDWVDGMTVDGRKEMREERHV
jgi:hypothetical protein